VRSYADLGCDAVVLATFYNNNHMREFNMSLGIIVFSQLVQMVFCRLQYKRTKELKKQLLACVLYTRPYHDVTNMVKNEPVGMKVFSPHVFYCKFHPP
jgi:hypothetical protein